MAVCASRGAFAQSASSDSAFPPGLQTTLAYTGALVSNVAGGQHRGSIYQGAGLVQFNLGLGKVIGWKGAQAFFSLLDTRGASTDSLVGVLQGVYALEAPPGLRLEEAWIQQDVLGNRLSLLAGRYDINFEFYRIQSSAIFFNDSFGLGPELDLSGARGPSTFPFTAVGARVAYKLVTNVVLRTALLDGVPVDRPDGGIHLFAPGDGVFAIGEAELVKRPATPATRRRDRRYPIGRGPPRIYETKLAVGGWTYTARFPDLVDTLANGTPRMHRGSSGAYLIGDATVWRARSKQSTLSLFGQLGFGDPRVVSVGAYVGGGLTMAGPFRTRPNDLAGLAIASAQTGSHFRRAQRAAGIPPSHTETTLEAAYIAQVARWLDVHADLQYVIHPGGTTTRRNALVPAIQIAVVRTR